MLLNAGNIVRANAPRRVQCPKHFGDRSVDESGAAIAFLNGLLAFQAEAKLKIEARGSAN